MMDRFSISDQEYSEFFSILTELSLPLECIDNISSVVEQKSKAEKYLLVSNAIQSLIDSGDIEERIVLEIEHMLEDESTKKDIDKTKNRGN